MKSKLNEAQLLEKVTDQSDAIDMIAKELTFLLVEANKHNPPVGTPLAAELAQRFMALYKDFCGVRANAEKLCQELDKVEFTDRTLGLVYKATAHLLVRKMGEGIFEQFISVAEFGQLPDGTTFNEEDSI